VSRSPLFASLLRETRRPLSIFKIFGVVFVVVVLSFGSHPVNAQERPFLVGGDVSMLSRIEDGGGVYKEEGRQDDALAIMRRNGCNCFRVRLFVDPNGEGGVVNDLEYTIDLARRIKAIGAALLLDLHYSDTWADPGHQRTPASWKSLEFPQLVEQVESYTTEVLNAFDKAGATPDYVQIGNEINPGFLWPQGRLDGSEESWARFTGLLKAGVRGVQREEGSVSPESTPKIVIHIAKGGDWPATRRFFEKIEEYEVPYDIIGQSYYPWWHGSLEELRDSLTRTAESFDKDVWVVETAYPYRGDAPRDVETPWEISPSGQKAFLEDVMNAVESIPHDRGLGVLWWYPESIPYGGPGMWMGGQNALFDEKGEMFPALDTFQ